MVTRIWSLTKGFALFLSLSLPAQIPDEFTMRLLAHETAWNAFIRTYFGCPVEGSFDPDLCKVAARETDSKLFSKACETAKEVFKLKGECDAI